MSLRTDDSSVFAYGSRAEVLRDGTGQGARAGRCTVLYVSARQMCKWTEQIRRANRLDLTAAAVFTAEQRWISRADRVVRATAREGTDERRDPKRQ